MKKTKSNKAVGNLFNDGVLVACDSQEVCGLYITEIDNVNIISKMIMSWLKSFDEDNDLGIKSLEEASKFVSDNFKSNGGDEGSYIYNYKTISATVNYI